MFFSLAFNSAINFGWEKKEEEEEERGGQVDVDSRQHLAKKKTKIWNRKIRRATTVCCCCCYCSQPPTVVCKMEAQGTHCTHKFLHVWHRLVMLSRCLLAIILHRNSGGSLLRVLCWLGLVLPLSKEIEASRRRNKLVWKF